MEVLEKMRKILQVQEKITEHMKDVDATLLAQQNLYFAKLKNKQQKPCIQKIENNKPLKS